MAKHQGRQKQRHPSDVPRPPAWSWTTARMCVRCAGRSSDSRARLLGLVDRATYWPSLPRTVRSSAYDGVRSHLPLRGSPGLTPGSLLRRSAWMAGRTSCDHEPYLGALTNSSTYILWRVARNTSQVCPARSHVETILTWPNRRTGDPQLKLRDNLARGHCSLIDRPAGPTPRW